MNAPLDHESILLAVIGGEPDCALFTRREWLSAATLAFDGDGADLDYLQAETDAFHEGRWAEAEPRIPRSLELPTSSVFGGYR